LIRRTHALRSRGSGPPKGRLKPIEARVQAGTVTLTVEPKSVTVIALQP